MDLLYQKSMKQNMMVWSICTVNMSLWLQKNPGILFSLMYTTANTDWGFQ